MNKNLIELISIWLIRLALVGAAIYFLTQGKPDYALGCGVGVFFTIIWF